ncbi:MAG: hypothetical protein Q4D91_06555 [Lautropia sp.]|nr:hypothetical protein [Lautropia sp.]
MFPIHEDEQQTEVMACFELVRPGARTDKCVTRAKTLAETFAGGHAAADVDDAFDVELDEIRQLSRQGCRVLDGGGEARG